MIDWLNLRLNWMWKDGRTAIVWGCLTGFAFAGWTLTVVWILESLRVNP